MLNQLFWMVAAVFSIIAGVNVIWWYGEYGKNNLLSANLALWPAIALIGFAAFCLIRSGVVP